MHLGPGKAEEHRHGNFAILGGLEHSREFGGEEEVSPVERTPTSTSKLNDASLPKHPDTRVRPFCEEHPNNSAKSNIVTNNFMGTGAKRASTI